MFVENPVLIKEVKTKMRSRQSRPVQLTVASLIGLFIIYCYYQGIYYLLKYSTTGNDLWQLAVGLQVILIWMLCPALTANAISQEKEQQTWEMLIFTLLTPGEILLGKLAARVVPMVALLVACFPFMVICLARSTLGLVDLLATYFLFGIWILFLTTVGLFMSWAFRKTASAIALSYLVVFMLLIGTVLLNSVFSAIGERWEESWIWWLNPIRITKALFELKSDPYAVGVIGLSSVTFLGITAFLMARMMTRFRAFSIE